MVDTSVDTSDEMYARILWAYLPSMYGWTLSMAGDEIVAWAQNGAGILRPERRSAGSRLYILTNDMLLRNLYLWFK